MRRAVGAAVGVAVGAALGGAASVEAASVEAAAVGAAAVGAAVGAASWAAVGAAAALATVSVAVICAAALGITAAFGFIVRHFIMIQRCMTCNFVKNFFMLVVTHMLCAQPFCLWLVAGIRQLAYNGD
jgi:hypothetical protein